VIDVEFVSAFPVESAKITNCDPQVIGAGLLIVLSGVAFVPGILATSFENTTVFLEDDQLLRFAPLILQQKWRSRSA
jgi:hypothetical protein